MSDHEEVEPLELGCEYCGVMLGAGRYRVPAAKGLPGTCFECAMQMEGPELDDSAAEEGRGIGDSDGYRDAMRDSGRGGLFR